MNPTECMHIFSRVAELTSFTQAAQALGVPKASVSQAVQQLEAQLGTRLLHRTTRRVTLTQDGQVFYERCKDLLADLDEAYAMFQRGSSVQGLSGRVRLDMSTGLARHAVLPHLPELLREHPLLELELSSTERRVDLVREGFDCVLRAGAVVDDNLVARPLGAMRMVNCASPAYLLAYGTPLVLADLAQHRLVHYANTFGGKPDSFVFEDAGHTKNLPMAGSVTVNNADAYTGACLAGLGIIQVPWVGVRALVGGGALALLLPAHTAPAMPLNLLYPNRRHVAQRVRVVMDWLAGVMAAHLAEA